MIEISGGIGFTSLLHKKICIMKHKVIPCNMTLWYNTNIQTCAAAQE
jgi:hypothetical protein